MTMENLTQLQKAAIEGEVCKAYSSARHNPEILYRLYTMLVSAPEDVKEYIIAVSKEVIEVKEDLLNKVILEATANEVPLWLWIDKVVADIKLSIKLACADGMVGDAELNKKAVQKSIVKSAFVCFCRSIAMKCTKAAKALCQHIIDEEPLDLDFLADVCFSLIAEINELEPTNDIPKELIHTEFDIRNMLSFKIETEVLEKRAKDYEKEKSQSDEPKPDEDIAKELAEALDQVEYGGKNITIVNISGAPKDSLLADAVSRTIAHVLDEQLKSKKATKQAEKAKECWAVVKEYKGENSVSSTLRTFDTEVEAQSFKEGIEKSYPELMKSCTLKIKKLIK